MFRLKRSGQQPQATGHDRTFPELGSMLARYLPVILLAAAVASGAVYAKSILLAPPANTATARVGLTNKVVWPFYDAERERLMELAANPNLRREIAASLPAGQQLIDFRVDKPVDQAYVDVVTTATTRDGAIRTADAAAQLLVSRTYDRQRNDANQRLAEANTELKAIEANIASMSAQLEQGTLTSSEATAINARREAEITRTGVFLEARDRATLDLKAANATTVEVLRTADTVAVQASDTLSQAALAALIVGLVAALLAVLYDARSAPLRSARHARFGIARDLPILTSDPTADSSAQTNLAKQLLNLCPGTNVLEFTGLSATETWSTILDISTGIREAGGRVVTVGSRSGPDAVPTVPLSIQGTHEGNGRSLDSGARVRSALQQAASLHLQVSLTRPQLANDDLLSVVELLAELRVLVLLDNRTESDLDRIRLPLSGRFSHGVIIVSKLRHTRQSDVRAAMQSVAQRGAKVVALILRSDTAAEDVPEHSEAQPDCQTNATAVTSVATSDAEVERTENGADRNGTYVGRAPSPAEATTREADDQPTPTPRPRPSPRPRQPVDNGGDSPAPGDGTYARSSHRGPR